MTASDHEKAPPTEDGHSSAAQDRVEEASQESFPASDPPSYTPSRSGGVDREIHLSSGEDGVTEAQDERSPLHVWAAQFCEALSGKGEAGLAALLAEDVAWRSGDGPLLVGHDAVVAWQAGHLEQFGTVKHHIIDVRGNDTALFIESEVMRGGGGGEPNHEAISVRLRGGHATRVQLYGSVYDPEVVVEITVEESEVSG